jgi:hypothetical protein
LQERLISDYPRDQLVSDFVEDFSELPRGRDVLQHVQDTLVGLVKLTERDLGAPEVLFLLACLESEAGSAELPPEVEIKIAVEENLLDLGEGQFLEDNDKMFLCQIS